MNLAEALKIYDHRLEAQTFGEWAECLPILSAAARRQVALELDPCGTCEGRGETYDEWAPVNRRVCSTCNGKGQTYKPETVEAVALELLDQDGQDLSGLIGSWAEERMIRYRLRAVAVLDAIRLLDQEAPR